MLSRFINWCIRLFKKEKPYHYFFVSDVPDSLKPRTVYLVTNEGYSWQLVITCPCGCGQTLYMNLIEEYDPYWTFILEGKTISLNPSVDRLVGCKSHFFLRHGLIKWC